VIARISRAGLILALWVSPVCAQYASTTAYAQSNASVDHIPVLEVSASAVSDRANGKPHTGDEPFALHGQMTFVVQHNLAFPSTFAGANSLNEHGETKETADITLYAGLRLWPGAEVWVNQEIDQGFGLANTLGAAGFPSGEGYKVGKANPYFRLQRAFVRQTIGLGSAREQVESDLNQLGGSRATDRLVVTVGKFSIGDVFDTNAYAHDPRTDFLNWTVIDAGTLDYAADAWGYSYGAAIELYKDHFALRAGLFNLSKVPNSETLESNFHQYQIVVEGETRFTINGRVGKLAMTGFLSHGKNGALHRRSCTRAS
jgi:high affinity Mn2+ porin